MIRRTIGRGIIIFLALVSIDFAFESEPRQPEQLEQPKVVRVFNEVKFARCMKRSQTAGKPLKILKKECKDYAEIIYGKLEAAKKCAKLKREEINWTEEEIDLYCNKLWRGYR